MTPGGPGMNQWVGELGPQHSAMICYVHLTDAPGLQQLTTCTTQEIPSPPAFPPPQHTHENGRGTGLPTCCQLWPSQPVT